MSGVAGANFWASLSVPLPCMHLLLKPQIPISDCLFVSVLVRDTCSHAPVIPDGNGEKCYPGLEEA